MVEQIFSTIEQTCQLYKGNLDSVVEVKLGYMGITNADDPKPVLAVAAMFCSAVVLGYGDNGKSFLMNLSLIDNPYTAFNVASKELKSGSYGLMVFRTQFFTPVKKESGLLEENIRNITSQSHGPIKYSLDNIMIITPNISTGTNPTDGVAFDVKDRKIYCYRVKWDNEGDIANAEYLKILMDTEHF